MGLVVADQLLVEGGGSGAAEGAMAFDLGDDFGGVDRAGAGEIDVGNEACDSGGEVGEENDGHCGEIDGVGSELESPFEGAMLKSEKAVGADGPFGVSCRSAGEGHEGGGMEIGGEDIWFRGSGCCVVAGRGVGVEGVRAGEGEACREVLRDCSDSSADESEEV